MIGIFKKYVSLNYSFRWKTVLIKWNWKYTLGRISINAHFRSFLLCCSLKLRRFRRSNHIIFSLYFQKPETKIWSYFPPFFSPIWLNCFDLVCCSGLEIVFNSFFITQLEKTKYVWNFNIGEERKNEWTFFYHSCVLPFLHKIYVENTIFFVYPHWQFWISINFIISCIPPFTFYNFI